MHEIPFEHRYRNITNHYIVYLSTRCRITGCLLRAVPHWHQLCIIFMYSVNTYAIRHRLYKPLVHVFWYPQRSGLTLCDAAGVKMWNLCNASTITSLYRKLEMTYLVVIIIIISKFFVYSSKPRTNLTIWSWEKSRKWN